MFESPAKVAVSPNSKTMSAAEQEALSRAEGRKLVVMFVLFVICSAFAVQLLLPEPKRPDDAPRGIPLTEEEMQEMDKRFIAEVKIKPFVENENVEKTAQDFAQDQFEDDIFHYYIHKVHQSTDQELASQFSGENIKYTDFNDLEKIQENRGKVQRLAGRILSYWQRVLQRWPNNSGLAWVWQAMVQTDDGIYMVVITDKDFEPEIGRLHGDSIEIDAVFIKGYQYSSKKGTLRMPLMAGRDFKRIRSATYDESYPLPLAYAMTIITLIMIFGGFLIHFYYKRADKSMGQHRASLRRKRMERNSKVDAAKTAKNLKDKAEAGDGVPVADGIGAPPSQSPESPEASTTPEASSPEPNESPEGSATAEAADAQTPEGGDAEQTSETAEDEAKSEASPETPSEPTNAEDAQEEATESEATQDAEASPPKDASPESTAETADAKTEDEAASKTDSPSPDA